MWKIEKGIPRVTADQIDSDSRGARPASRQVDHHNRLPRSFTCGSLCGATLQRYLGPKGLYCPSEDREERFGLEKYGDRWIGRQTQDDLAWLERVRDRNKDWQEFEPGSNPKHLPSNYCGPPGSEGGIDRALRRTRMLAQVREDLVLLDLFGDVSNAALSKLSNEDVKKLREAQRIASSITGSEYVPDPDLRAAIGTAVEIQQQQPPKSEIAYRPRRTVSKAPPPPPQINPNNYSVVLEGKQRPLTKIEKKILNAVESLWNGQIPESMTLSEREKEVGRYIDHELKGQTVPGKSSFKRFWKAVRLGEICLSSKQ
jgi:hypothetical protein